MYNLNANYTIGMGGYPGAGAIAGCGYMNPAMMGMYAMGPMANVGIGQFKADYLLQGEDQLNNYYARPVPVHKKENETGTILGILGTALGTAALLAALAKGRFKRAPKAPRPTTPSGAANNTVVPGPKPDAPKPPTGGTQTTNNTTTQSPIKGYLENKPINPNSLPAPIYQNPTIKPKNPGTAPAPTGTTAPTGNTNPQPAGYLPQYTSRMQNALNKQAAAMNLPSSGNVIVTPAASQNVAGYLPQHTSRMQNALNKQAAAMNLPSSGNVITAPGAIANTPVVAGAEAAAPTTITMPKATNAPKIKYDWKSDAVYVPYFEAAPKAALPAPAQGGVPATTAKINLKPITEYYNTGRQTYNIPSGAPKAALPSTVAAANEKLASVRPDLAAKGEVVYTTQTPQSMSNGYSIGSNAKGADKLAALLAQMNA